MPDRSENAASVSLARDIGRWSMLALTVNCVVGAGILGLPGRVFALAGSATLWVLAGAAVLATAAALCLAELGSRYEGTGGPVEYCRAAFGRPAGFAAGWLLWTATILGAASLLNLVAGLLMPTHRIAAVLAIGAAMTGLAMAGVARSTAASSALTALKLVLLTGFIGAGMTAPAAPAIPDAAPQHVSQALVLLFFAFVGFERPTAVAGEVKDARRAVPFALAAGMAVVTALYAGVFLACLRGLPDLAASEQPVRDLAARLFGAGAAGALAWGAGLIVLGTLTTQWITAPRLLLALARDGQMPAGLARLSARRHTPDGAIAVTGAVAVLLALPGDFAATVAASSASRLLIFIGCAAALLKLRRATHAPAARFRLPGGAVIATCVIGACAILLATAAAEVARLAATLGIGALLWLITKRRERR